jgi:hypothetical protein
MQIEQLIAKALDDAPDITVQMNPTEVKEINETTSQQNPGANNPKSGTPKVSHATKQARQFIYSTTYDNFESNEDVVAMYINAYQKGTDYIKEGKILRKPVYRLSWGEKLYSRRCFLDKFQCTITKHGPNGRPLRAEVTAYFTEVEDINADNQANDSFDVNQATRNQGSLSFASLISSLWNV